MEFMKSDFSKDGLEHCINVTMATDDLGDHVISPRPPTLLSYPSDLERRAKDICDPKGI